MSRPSSADASRKPRKTTTSSGAQALKAIDTSIRPMPIQQYAVPPKNEPIMEFSKTAPALTSSRKSIRNSMRQSEVRHHEEIQQVASMDGRARRRRTQRQNSEMQFHRNRFSKGVEHYQQSIDRRVQFIKDLEDKDRARQTEMEIEKGRQAYDAAEEYVFEYKKATHLTDPREVIELKDITREERLYKESQEVIVKSKEFSEDYKSSHVGKVHLPPKTPWQIEQETNSNAYIAKTQRKEDAHQSVNDAKAQANKLYHDADQAEEKVRTIAVNLEKTGNSMSFEARIAARKKMMVVKDEADFLREQATVASNKADALKKEMEAIVYADTVTPLDFEEMEGKVEPRIESWVLAMPLQEGGLGKVYYGAFATGSSPPLNGWVGVHADAEEKPKFVLKGPPERALKVKQTQLKQRELAIANGDDVPPPPSDAKSKTVLAWMITGCAIPECNGRYIECGHVKGVFKFQNEEGVTLMKTVLKESPDLEITAATCNKDGVAGHDDDLGRKLTRIVALPDSEIEVTDLAKNPKDWGRDFNAISRAGLSMITLGLKEKLRRKQEQKAEAERRAEQDFNKTLKDAGAALDTHGGEGGEIKTETRIKEVDREMASLFPANQTFQASDHDIGMIIPGADRVIEVRPDAVPPLCRAWVLLSCPKHPDHCKHRHYFCSAQEKRDGVEWRQMKDTKAEMRVLKCIAAREVLLVQIKAESERSSKQYFADSEHAGVQEKHVRVLLTLLDRLRLVTVQTCEAIILWRDAVEQQALLREDNETKKARQTWVVTVASTGGRLYDASPAYRSNVKRFRRDKELPKHANNVRYLGVFKNKVEAARAYDAAMLQEAVRQGTTASRMPEKRFVLRACQKHYAVESVTSPKYRPCEQCLAKKYNGHAQYTPAYIWNGENYLLKMGGDLHFLQQNEGLKQWLGDSFVFEGNPFMLAAGVDNYVSLADEDDNQYPETPLGTATANPSRTATAASGSRGSLMAEPNENLDVTSFQPEKISEEINTLRGTSAPFSFSAMRTGTAPGDSDSNGGGNLSPRPNTSSIASTLTLKPRQREALENPASRGNFGTPGQVLTDHGDGLNEWGGKTTLGTKFVVDMPFHPSSTVVPGEEKKDDFSGSPRSTGSPQQNQREEKTTKRVFEVLEIQRIAAAWKQVELESALQELLHHDDSSNHDDAKLSKHPLGYLINGAPKSRHQKLPTMKQPGMVITYAVYKDHGAMLSMEQQRKPLAHRSDQIWCRSDVGEWAGMVKRGANMRSFEFGVKLKEEGKKKQQERVRVGANLRKEVLKDISEVSIEKIKGLIVEALELKGSRLKLDVETAELFLKKYDDWTVAAKLLERVIRGFLGRCKFSKRYQLVLKKYKERMRFFKSIASTAKSTVADFLHKGSHNAARNITRPRHSTVQVMDNDYWLVALYSLEHHDYVNLSEDYPRQALGPAARGERPKLTFDPETQTFQFYRGPFGYRRKRTPERLLVKAYTGVTGECLKMIIDSDTLRSKLHEQEICKLAEASDQVSKACKLQELEIDAPLLYGDPRFDRHNVGLRARTYWEPIREARILETNAADTRAASERLDNLTVAKRWQMQASKRQEERRREEREGAYMEYEEMATRVVEDHLSWNDAIVETKRSLEFSQEALRKMEDLTMVDWAQSWDPFENGNNWRQIVKKRNMERQAKGAWKRAADARSKLFHTYMAHCASVRKMKEAIKLYKFTAKANEDLKKVAEYAVHIASIARSMTDEVVHRIVSMMTIRVRPTVPISRRLLWIDRMWALAHTPEARVQKRCLKNWNVLARETRLVYEPDSAFVEERQRGRFIITVLHDQLTGYILVQGWCAGGGNGKNEVPVEIPISPEEVIEILLEQGRGDLCKPLLVKAGGFSYFNLKRLKAERQTAICGVIMNCLRLDTFRNTLTVGQLNFARIRTKLLSSLYDTLWWTDSARGRSSGKGTKVFQECRKVGNRLVYVGVYENWGDFLFECYEPKLSQVYTLHATMPELLYTLRDTPAAIASYLTGVRINRYTEELFKVVLDRLDFSLPGENGRWWRQQLWNETPRLSLHKEHSSCYRGPLYHEQRRVSRRTVVAKIMASSRGDFRLLIERGQHGVEHSRYNGPPLKLDIDKEALRRIVRADLTLLKPSRKLELYKFLFDKLELVHADDEALTSQPAWKTALERERFGLERMESALAAHTKWSKLTNAPVIREVDKFVKDETARMRDAFMLYLKREIEEDDQFEIVYEGSWSAAEHRHFTARICITDKSEFAVSLREENKFEMWGRWEHKEREIMAVEDERSRKASEVAQMIHDQAAVHTLHLKRERAERENDLKVMRMERRAKNLGQKFVKELREMRETRAKTMIDNARYVAKAMVKQLAMKDGELVIFPNNVWKGQKKRIFQMRSFSHHGVSETWKYSKALEELKSGKLPKGVADNDAFTDVTERRLRRKHDGSMKLKKNRFSGVGMVVQQSHAKVQFKWKSRGKIRRVTPSKRGVISREVIVKPFVRMFDGKLFTVWGELRRKLKDERFVELAYFAYDPETSKSFGVALRGPTGFTNVLANSCKVSDRFMGVEGLADLAKETAENVLSLVTLKTTISTNRKSATAEVEEFKESLHANDERLLLRRVITRMLRKQESQAFAHWIGLIRSEKQSQQVANVLLIKTDMMAKVKMLNVSMKSWTDDIRKSLGVGDGPEELSMVTANKAIFFCSKQDQEDAEPKKKNVKAGQFAGEGHVFYGKVVWAMLHGLEPMRAIVAWDDRIVAALQEGSERKQNLEDRHEESRDEHRQDFIQLNIERAERMLPHLKRAMAFEDVKQNVYLRHPMVKFIHNLRKKAEKDSFPSDRIDPFIKPEDEEDYREELKKGDAAFPAVGLMRPWWCWSVCLRCHARDCGVAFMSCKVPFCSEARKAVTNSLENFEEVQGGLTYDKVFKERVWNKVGELQEVWHEDFEHDEDDRKAALGIPKKMDPWERKQYICRQLRNTGRMLKGLFGARDAAASRRSMAGAEGTPGWVAALAEERNIANLHLLVPDRRVLGDAMGLWDDDDEATEDEDGDGSLNLDDGGVMKLRSSIKLRKKFIGMLVGSGGVDGFGKKIEVGMKRIMEDEYLGDKEFFKWLLSRLTLGPKAGEVVEDKEGEVAGEEGEGAEADTGPDPLESPSKQKKKGGWGSKLGGLLGKMSPKKTGEADLASLAGSLNTVSIVEAAQMRENHLKTGLGELRFSNYHTKNVTKVSGNVCIVDVQQEDVTLNEEYDIDKKTQTAEELLDEENPGLVVKCLDPLTSATSVITVSQSVIATTPILRDSGLTSLAQRPKLAKFIAENAQKIFAFQEKNGRIQLVLAGETEAATYETRLEAKMLILEKLMAHKKQLEAKKRKLQNECRVLRLEEYREKMVTKREALNRKMLIASVKEWQGMHSEDIIASQLRTFLTCDSNTLNEIRIAFEIFDLDGNGTINKTEFQALCFELGQVMTEKELAEAMNVIDLDGNGVVQFHEFACWWIERPKVGEGVSSDANHKMLELKLKMLKRAKGIMGRMGGLTLGGGNRARAKQKKDILTPLRLSKEDPGKGKEGTKDGLMGKLFGGGGGSGGEKAGFRPKTV
ncbi:hypothetical protein TrST_g11716 [Triparma strigata]|uniref:EF-hand domain-containing protein n=1 Tax=Triparma strigata TaxID=1606541 RepID=A0A9W6ZF47_9STRA|nr:hypothetical protein TrST_g11716 [Triparma strigata]